MKGNKMKNDPVILERKRLKELATRIVELISQNRPQVLKTIHDEQQEIVEQADNARQVLIAQGGRSREELIESNPDLADILPHVMPNSATLPPETQLVAERLWELWKENKALSKSELNEVCVSEGYCMNAKHQWLTIVGDSRKLEEPGGYIWLLDPCPPGLKLFNSSGEQNEAILVLEPYSVWQTVYTGRTVRGDEG